MQVKATARYHFTPIGCLKFKKKIIICVGKDLGEILPLYTADGIVKWCANFVKGIVKVLVEPQLVI